MDNLSKPETIQGVKNLGWGSITMRNNSELRLVGMALERKRHMERSGDEERLLRRQR